MKAIHSIALGALMTCASLNAGNQAPAGNTREEKTEQSNIQLAILLDTSGSMEGLINQARSHIWKIVNDLTLAKQNGKLPNIEIALYEYGNHDSDSSYMRQVLPLTNDLDELSEALFNLKITGSEEYCGTVIKKAVEDLAWNNEDKNALKMIFIAGNEEFDQGKIKPEDAIREALAKSVTINTIYCGTNGDSVSSGWSSGATKGDGCYVSIDHNSIQADPATPYDKELAQLGTDINKTYLAYGDRRAREQSTLRQETQDFSAGSMGSAVAAERTIVKSKAVYNNKEWDLVDEMADNGNNVSVAQLIASGKLSDELEGKTEEEIKTIVREKGEERKKIQAQIKDISKKRRNWLLENAEKNDDKSSLDNAVINAVRQQAEGKQFQFDQK